MRSPDPRLVAAPVDGLDDAALAELFTLVYAGYFVPMHVDAAAMRFMRVACDLDLGASRLLREDDATVAVAMLGRRGDAGWIGGMGVAPECRSRGLGGVVMREVLDSARALGTRRVSLEVLEQNTPAIKLYERLGFRRTRELEVWTLPAPEPRRGDPAVEPAGLEEAHAFIRAHRRAVEPWQRADGTLAALRADGVAFEAVRTVRAGRAVGAAILRVAGRASVVQMASSPGEEEAATHAMLAALRRDDAPQGVRWLNLPSDDPATAVVRALGATREAAQQEMELPLG
jgi:GNAT superfamily N-acetyltransferase